MPRSLLGLVAAWLVVASPQATAQSTLGSRNVVLEARLPLGGTAGALFLDQHPDRPYAYVALDAEVAVVSVQAPADPRVLGRIGQEPAPRALALLETRDRRHLLAVGHDEGIDWIDVSDPRRPSRGTRTVLPGVKALFAYHASDGRRILLAAAGDRAFVIDAAAPSLALFEIGIPEGARGRHRTMEGVFALFDLATGTDRVYTSGTGGYSVFDVTGWTGARLVTFVQPAIVDVGTRAQVSPDGLQLVTTAGYATAPTRIFDLRPALDGSVSTVRTDVGAWTADWRGVARDFQLRWPYLFVASGPAGFHVVNVRNPQEAYTTAFWRTWEGTDEAEGAVSVDVRDHDGLVAVSDAATGLWLLRIEDFRGWDGRGWGVPDLGPAQRWSRLPTEADRW